MKPHEFWTQEGFLGLDYMECYLISFFLFVFTVWVTFKPLSRFLRMLEVRSIDMIYYHSHHHDMVRAFFGLGPRFMTLDDNNISNEKKEQSLDV
jgi:hypothetical protein